MAKISNNYIASAIYSVLKDKKGEEARKAYKDTVRFLYRKRLLSKSGDILEKLDKIINKNEGRLEVKVESAKGLKNEFKKELASFIKERYKAKDVVLKEKEDERLLGGFKLEVGDEIIDLTAKDKIKKLQGYLIKKI